MKVEELPAVVNELALIFSLYSDNHPGQRCRYLHNANQNSSLSATYNGKGKLIRVVKSYKDVDCLTK
jgi:hypothetical protein